MRVDPRNSFSAFKSASFWTPAFDRRREVSPASDSERAMRRCSAETYSSPKSRAISKARSRARVSSREGAASADAPETLGRRSRSDSTSAASASGLTPSFWRMGAATPSLWRSRASNRWSGVSSALPRARASRCASWMASCDLIVSWSNLIGWNFQKETPPERGSAVFVCGLRSNRLLLLLALAAADRNLARLGFRLLGQLELQQAVGESRLDAFAVHRGRQREGSTELAIGALDAGETAVLLLGLMLAFAREREHVSMEFDIDVLLLEAGQLRHQGNLIRVLGDVHWGHPRARSQSVILIPAPQKLPEQARHRKVGTSHGRKQAGRTKRIPTSQTQIHTSSPPFDTSQFVWILQG